MIVSHSKAEALTPNKSLGCLTHYLRRSWVWMHCTSQVCSRQTMLHAECDLQGRDQPLANQQNKFQHGCAGYKWMETSPRKQTSSSHQITSQTDFLLPTVPPKYDHQHGVPQLWPPKSPWFQGKIKLNGKWLILHVKDEPSCYNLIRARRCLMRVDLAMNTLTTKLCNPSVPTICPVAPLGATLKAAYPSSTPSQRLRSTSSACRMKVVKSLPAPWSKRNTEAQVPVCDTTMHMCWPSQSQTHHKQCRKL